jgi:ECF transporter S component (folate family)
LAVTAMLVALEIILTRFLSIQAPGIRISIGFIPIVVIAILYGPVVAGIGAAIADLMGVVLFGIGVPFPGFTVTAFLAGIIYGLLLYNRPKTLFRICIAAVIVTVVLQLGFDTIWLTIILEDGFIALLPFRIIRTLIMIPVQIVCIRFITGDKFLRHISLAMRY